MINKTCSRQEIEALAQLGKDMEKMEKEFDTKKSVVVALNFLTEQYESYCLMHDYPLKTISWSKTESNHYKVKAEFYPIRYLFFKTNIKVIYQDAPNFIRSKGYLWEFLHGFQGNCVTFTFKESLLEKWAQSLYDLGAIEERE